MDIIDTFQNRLKKAMAIRNIKQHELVEKSGIDKTLINKYLAGISKARQNKLTLLSDALDINEVWLMGYNVPMDRYLNNDISPTSNKIIQIPVIEKITAGQPITTSKDMENCLPVIPEIYGITEHSEYFYLLVKGDSMDRRIHDGDYALIHKQDYATNGNIVVAIVNGNEEATLRRYKEISKQYIQLEPMSTNPIHEIITIDLKKTDFKIIGKAIGNFGIFKEDNI